MACACATTRPRTGGSIAGTTTVSAKIEDVLVATTWYLPAVPPAVNTPPGEMPPPVALVTDNGWKGQKDGFGPPDLTVKSSE